MPFPAPISRSPDFIFFSPASLCGCCHIFSRNLWRSFHFDPKIFEQAETIPSFRNPGLSHCPVLLPDIFLPDRPAHHRYFSFSSLIVTFSFSPYILKYFIQQGFCSSVIHSAVNRPQKQIDQKQTDTETVNQKESGDPLVIRAATFCNRPHSCHDKHIVCICFEKLRYWSFRRYL